MVETSASTPLISCTLEGQPQKPSNSDVVAAETQSCLLSFVMWRSPEQTYCPEVQCSNCRRCKLLSPICWFLLLALIVVENVIYIMQSGSLYLAKTDQLLCFSSLCFSHTQRAWETPQECPVWWCGSCWPLRHVRVPHYCLGCLMLQNPALSLRSCDSLSASSGLSEILWRPSSLFFQILGKKKTP